MTGSQVIWGLVGHCKDCGFCCDLNGKPLEGCEERRKVITMCYSCREWIVKRKGKREAGRPGSILLQSYRQIMVDLSSVD